MNDNTSWVIIDEREATGSINTWSEYLCVSRTDDPNNFERAICRYEMVGEIPQEWFDAEGQPLPEYSDSDGYLEIPEYIEHRYAGGIFNTKLSGHDGEYLLGELVYDETYGGPISVKIKEVEKLADVLMIFQWVAADVDGLIDAIKRCIS
jgi:hypothetical protein